MQAHGTVRGQWGISGQKRYSTRRPPVATGTRAKARYYELPVERCMVVCSRPIYRPFNFQSTKPFSCRKYLSRADVGARRAVPAVAYAVLAEYEARGALEGRNRVPCHAPRWPPQRALKRATTNYRPNAAIWFVVETFVRV